MATILKCWQHELRPKKEGSSKLFSKTLWEPMEDLQLHVVSTYNYSTIDVNCWSYYYNLFKRFYFNNIWIKILVRLWIVYRVAKVRVKQVAKKICSIIILHHSTLIQEVLLKDYLYTCSIIFQIFFEALICCQVISFWAIILS